MEIDSKNIDREEERRIERKQQENRFQQEKRMQREGMKTFEAKLSEKSAAEITQKDEARQVWHDGKKTKEEKQNLLEKIIAVAKEKTGQQEKQRVQSVGKQDERKQEETKEETTRRADLLRREKTDSQGEDKGKKSEVSPDGHRRVVEKQQGEGGGSGAFGEGFSGDVGGGGQFGAQSGSREGKKSFAKQEILNRVNPVSNISSAGRGFDARARGFTKANLDEIVVKIHLGLNERGEQEFSVELSDVYFNGLKIACARTDEGTVVKFICPDVSVRSTFLKNRPKLYLHLKQKGLKIFRIEVI